MHPANLRSLDLNLLVVLDALLRERHVTRAAQALVMTQPAVSQALARLRLQFGDPLLERQGRGLRLTARAEQLAPALARLLADVRVLTQAQGEPTLAAPRTFRIAWPDVAALTLLPPLLAALRPTLRQLTLVCLGWTLADQEVERLRSGQSDLALSSTAVLPADLRRVRLGPVNYVGIARWGHPLFARRTGSRDVVLPAPAWSRLVTQPFVLVSALGQTRSELDGHLEAAGLHRHIAAVLPQFLGVPALVAASDLLAYVPAALARWWSQREPLLRFEAPAALATPMLDLLWHRRLDDDPAHRLLREQLITIARDAFSHSAPDPRPAAAATASRVD